MQKGAVVLNVDTQLGAFGPGADPMRSRAAYPPPRLHDDVRGPRPDTLGKRSKGSLKSGIRKYEASASENPGVIPSRAVV